MPNHFSGVGGSAHGVFRAHPEGLPRLEHLLRVAGAGAGLALALGGLGSGLLMSLGPALATQSVSVDERGEAIAVAGTFRAVALLVTPGVTAAALTIVSLPVGLVMAALAIGVPPIAAALRRKPAPAPSSG